MKRLGSVLLNPLTCCNTDLEIHVYSSLLRVCVCSLHLYHYAFICTVQLVYSSAQYSTCKGQVCMSTARQFCTNPDQVYPGLFSQRARPLIWLYYVVQPKPICVKGVWLHVALNTLNNFKWPKGTLRFFGLIQCPLV